ncbi:deoxyribose-phosphate aldolase [Bacillus thuringiensis]|uniref:Deoxyribose-phosphate aldolase n=3 Tax=Bacillus thuringiensis TaxID=1428 RepID=A0AB35P829_BACTU|nr:MULTISPECIES: deoxyribose-phosphate aldolase [Bacillus]MED1157547.1 deoxyribose-phosphate aldolase [Bacillus paranthracis]AFQ25584.1 deoxyribose-phosphate aldolase [Bacillus thuringiensis HD-789]AJH03649.1 deoxyribose-phosphate aldolase [Bacillus thuringiensis HD1002]AND23776.1 2-deoxyribose-5-phosphate aldolase [Bacillus thuringiensis serovar israelensis]EEN03549.1 Deoxyribose-phosphate aldolase [Bacillus thuringiensis IBL 4222]
MNIAKLIDHTILKANTTKEDVMKVIEEAKEYKFASVCINPTWVKLAAEELAGHGVDVCTVIGFPLGASTTETKAFETKDAIEKGATEVDMVINVGALKDGDNEFVEKDIYEVVQAAKGKALVKVIIETCLLTDEEKVRACELSVKAGADFVKTSTGFSTGGATAEDIALMRKTVGPNVGVKASGGVRTREDADKMVAAGASRVGASASVAIVLNDAKGATDNY